MASVQGYLREVTKEMRKVSWPKREELIGNTVITIIATVIISLIIFGVDRFIGAVLDFIY